jgi:hypothetical protein
MSPGGTDPVEVSHHSVLMETVDVHSDGLGWCHRGCSLQVLLAAQDGSSVIAPY